MGCTYISWQFPPDSSITISRPTTFYHFIIIMFATKSFALLSVIAALSAQVAGESLLLTAAAQR